MSFINILDIFRCAIINIISAELTDYIYQEWHPPLRGAFGSLDGLHLPVQSSYIDLKLENITYNRWLHTHCTSSVFAFVPNGVRPGLCPAFQTGYGNTCQPSRSSTHHSTAQLTHSAENATAQGLRNNNMSQCSSTALQTSDQHRFAISSCSDLLRDH